MAYYFGIFMSTPQKFTLDELSKLTKKKADLHISLTTAKCTTLPRQTYGLKATTWANMKLEKT
jgi:hypothetical protein